MPGALRLTSNRPIARDLISDPHVATARVLRFGQHQKTANRSAWFLANLKWPAGRPINYLVGFPRWRLGGQHRRHADQDFFVDCGFVFDRREGCEPFGFEATLDAMGIARTANLTEIDRHFTFLTGQAHAGHDIANGVSVALLGQLGIKLFNPKRELPIDTNNLLIGQRTSSRP